MVAKARSMCACGGPDLLKPNRTKSVRSVGTVYRQPPKRFSNELACMGGAAPVRTGALSGLLAGAGRSSPALAVLTFACSACGFGRTARTDAVAVCGLAAGLVAAVCVG